MYKRQAQAETSSVTNLVPRVDPKTVAPAEADVPSKIASTKSYAPWTKKSKEIEAWVKPLVEKESSQPKVYITPALDVMTSSIKKSYAPWKVYAAGSSSAPGLARTISTSASPIVSEEGSSNVRSSTPGSRNYSPYRKVETMSPIVPGPLSPATKEAVALSSSEVSVSLDSDPTRSAKKSYSPWSTKSKYGNNGVTVGGTGPVVSLKGNEIVQSGKVSSSNTAHSERAKTYAPWKKYGTVSSSSPSSGAVAATSASPLVSEKVSSNIISSIPGSRSYSPYKKVKDMSPIVPGPLTPESREAVALSSSELSVSLDLSLIHI